MCGICGVLSYDEVPDTGLVERMIGRINHRGPDGSGWYRDADCALGHARLAIVGIESGAQPLCNEDGTVWVSFNGEIFNYVELRSTLQQLGHTFTTQTDTEVIVHGWEEWGPGCFERFNGQWAIALWDRRTRSLILSRDRMGIRPLYYTRTGTKLLFASEVKCLFADPRVTREFDPAGLAETFTFWSTVAPQTVFAGVAQLPPGHYAVVTKSGIDVRAYWQMSFPQRDSVSSQDLAENTAELRERIIESVRLRFQRSDVPVGAYLSGGIDSSITAAIIARYTDAPLHTFSLRFSDAEFDEGHYQSEMVQRLGADHQDVVVSPAQIGEVFPTVIGSTESPILRSAPAPLYLLSQLVRNNGYKVVVTGEGADEVLAGYDIFREARVRLFWSRDQDSQLRSRAAELLYPWMARSPGKAPAFARGFFGKNLDPADPGLSHRPRWDSTSAVKAMLTPQLRESLPTGVTEALLDRLPAEHDGWDPLSRGQWLETTTLLPGYLLSSQGDRMLMANSVEGRFPFLDHHVVDFANRLPGRHKLLGLDEKHILKLAFSDLVPQDIINRPKQPYRAPDASSFFGEDAPQWVGEALSKDSVNAAGVFNPDMVERLVAKCQRTGGRGISNTDNMRTMAVVSTQLTHELFIAGAGHFDSPPPEPVLRIDMLAEQKERNP